MSSSILEHSLTQPKHVTRTNPQTNLQEHVQDIKYTPHNLIAPISLKCSLYLDIGNESIGPLAYMSN